ncbi:hypothetical protein QP157_14580 [Sphingomonas sp. LR61]|uniref:hypothetical protein n=1 Tax=Sphingomonas sp. LR61 TaxID=3050234 RepID=UPI002FDF33C6
MAVGPPPLGGADVLYVHGWSDYFFQREMAEHLEALGARFFALDLRKYGRSLLPHQTPGTSTTSPSTTRTSLRHSTPSGTVTPSTDVDDSSCSATRPAG